jgi:SAM-dependent methyltransferase
MKTDATTPMREDRQARLNAEVWARGEFVDFYATRELRVVESRLLDRCRDARVLELGCGAGRLTGHLCEVARDVHGLDISPAMVAHCRRTYPRGTFSEGDLRDLSRFERGSLDVVMAPFNVLDVLGDAERRRVLEQIRGVLVTGGLLIMSSHNRGYSPSRRARIRAYMGSPRHPGAGIGRLPLRLRNHVRLASMQRQEEEYAIVNDEAHDFSVLHYHVSRDAQERQFAQHGFELLECLDRDGRAVASGAAASHCPELHYLARVAQPAV